MMHLSLTNRTPSALSSRRLGTAARAVRVLSAGVSLLPDKFKIEKALHRSKERKTRGVMEYVAKYMILTTDSKVGGGGRDCGMRQSKSQHSAKSAYLAWDENFRRRHGLHRHGRPLSTGHARPLCRHHIGIPTCSWYAQALCELFFIKDGRSLIPVHVASYM